MRRRLFALFGIAVMVKISVLGIAQFQQPLIVMDETLYFLQAKELWINRTYILHGKTFGAQYPPLYPLIHLLHQISPPCYFLGERGVRPPELILRGPRSSLALVASHLTLPPNSENSENSEEGGNERE